MPSRRWEEFLPGAARPAVIGPLLRDGGAAQQGGHRRASGIGRSSVERGAAKGPVAHLRGDFVEDVTDFVDYSHAAKLPGRRQLGPKWHGRHGDAPSVVAADRLSRASRLVEGGRAFGSQPAGAGIVPLEGRRFGARCRSRWRLDGAPDLPREKRPLHSPPPCSTRGSTASCFSSSRRR